LLACDRVASRNQGLEGELLERLTGEGVTRILGTRAARAGTPARAAPQGLRHAAFTALLDAAVGLPEAPRVSRHSDPRALMRYDGNRADITGEMAQAASAPV
jgi:hypothetical protein